MSLSGIGCTLLTSSAIKLTILPTPAPSLALLALESFTSMPKATHEKRTNVYGKRTNHAPIFHSLHPHLLPQRYPSSSTPYNKWRSSIRCVYAMQHDDQTIDLPSFGRGSFIYEMLGFVAVVCSCRHQPLVSGSFLLFVYVRL